MCAAGKKWSVGRRRDGRVKTPRRLRIRTIGRSLRAADARPLPGERGSSGGSGVGHVAFQRRSAHFNFEQTRPTFRVSSRPPRPTSPTLSLSRSEADARELRINRRTQCSPPPWQQSGRLSSPHRFPCVSPVSRQLATTGGPVIFREFLSREKHRERGRER